MFSDKWNTMFHDFKVYVPYFILMMASSLRKEHPILYILTILINNSPVVNMTKYLQNITCEQHICLKQSKKLNSLGLIKACVFYSLCGC